MYRELSNQRVNNSVFVANVAYLMANSTELPLPSFEICFYDIISFIYLSTIQITGTTVPFLASLSNSFGPVEPKVNEKDVPATPAPIYRFVPEFEITNFNQAPQSVAYAPIVDTVASASPVVSVAEPISAVEPVSVVKTYGPY